MNNALPLFLLASLGLPAAAATAPAPAPGIVYYSNGSQEMLSFERIVQLKPDALKEKLDDIAQDTEWIKNTYSGPPFNNPKLYATIVQETIAQGKAVLVALQARKTSVDSCAGLDISPAAECATAAQRANAELDRRIQSVSAFVSAFEKDAAALKKP